MRKCVMKSMKSMNACKLIPGVPGFAGQVKCKANAESNLYGYAEPQPSLAVATYLRRQN